MSNFKNNNQWSNEDLAKSGKGRCWEGYEPAKGKKPYEKGSCVKKGEEAEKADHGKVAPEGSTNRKTYLQEFEKENGGETVELAKNGQWSLKKASTNHISFQGSDDKNQPNVNKMDGGVNCAPADGGAGGMDMGKKEHDDEKEDEKLIDEKIKEHEDEKHSKEGHEKEHKKMGLKKEEEMKKNPMAAAAVGAAATGFGSKMADKVGDKMGL